MQIAIAFAYALVPFVRRYTTWAVLGLAVAAPAAAWAAKKSGEALKNRLIDRGLTSDQILTQIDQHNDYADVAAWSSLVLGLLMLGLVAMLARKGRGSGSSDSDVTAGGGARWRGSAGRGGATVIALALTVLILGVGGVTGFYIFKAGDSGAHMVWQDI